MLGSVDERSINRRRKKRRGADTLLLHHAAQVAAAEQAMRGADAPTRDRILDEQWAPHYAALCRLPARTWFGLTAKIQALLDEHENGDTIHAADLRRTIRAAIKDGPT